MVYISAGMRQRRTFFPFLGALLVEKSLLGLLIPEPPNWTNLDPLSLWRLWVLLSPVLRSVIAPASRFRFCCVEEYCD